MSYSGGVKPKINVEFWAKPSEGDTLSGLRIKLEKAGNEIAETDHVNQRIKILQRGK